MNGRRNRVLRGGSWNNNDPANLRCAYRNNNDPGNRKNNIGFRVVWLVGCSARRRQPKPQESARCRMGSRPVRPVPRGCLTRPIRAPEERGKDAARAVAGNGPPLAGGRPRKSRPAAVSG